MDIQISADICNQKYSYIKCGQMFVYVYHIYVCICGLIQSHLFCILTHIKYNQNLNFSLWWWYLYVCALGCIEMWNFSIMSTFSKKTDIKLNRVWNLENFIFKHWTKGEKLIKSGTPCGILRNFKFFSLALFRSNLKIFLFALMYCLLVYIWNMDSYLEKQKRGWKKIISLCTTMRTLWI